MDNLTHTLVGLALADAGRKRTSRLGTAVVVVGAASAAQAGNRFLQWSRFPQFVTEHRGDSIRVLMSDARYAHPGGRSRASVAVTVPLSASIP